MKRIMLIVCSLGLWFPSSWATADKIISDVVAGMHTIPLLDGISVFGDQVASVDGSYDIEHIDNEDKLGFKCALKLQSFFYNPIKEEGMFHTTYYTAKEILEVYQELAARARRLNPDAVAFFKDLLTHGNMYRHPLSHLFKQPERAAIFKEVFNIRFDKPTDSITKLQAIRDELLAEEEVRAYVEQQSKLAWKQPDAESTTSTLRRRNVKSAEGDACGGAVETGIEFSSEKTSLLPKRIPAH